MSVNACHVPGCVLHGNHRGARAGRHLNAARQWFTATPRTPAKPVRLATVLELKPRHGGRTAAGTHGTVAEYKRHKRAGQPACPACLKAAADYQRDRWSKRKIEERRADRAARALRLVP